MTRKQQKKRADELIRALEEEVGLVKKMREEIYFEVQAVVSGEKFIDRLVERINNKQLK